MHPILLVPPTTLVVDSDVVRLDPAEVVRIVSAYHRNRWRATIYRDRVVTEMLYVQAAIVLGYSEIEVFQIHDGTPDLSEN